MSRPRKSHTAKDAEDAKKAVRWGAKESIQRVVKDAEDAMEIIT